MSIGQYINVYLEPEARTLREVYLILNEANVLNQNEVPAIRKILADGLHNNFSKEEIEAKLDEKDFESLMYGYTLMLNTKVY